MSRSKRSVAKQRKAAARRAHATPAPESAANEERFGPARRRGQLAKATLAGAAAVGFGIWMALARVTYAGHAKHPVQALSIPQPLYQVVRRNLLQAGIIAPATAPPDATTSTS
jgi:hypothetical protein